MWICGRCAQVPVTPFHKLEFRFAAGGTPFLNAERHRA